MDDNAYRRGFEAGQRGGIFTGQSTDTLDCTMILFNNVVLRYAIVRNDLCGVMRACATACHPLSPA